MRLTNVFPLIVSLSSSQPHEHRNFRKFVEAYIVSIICPFPELGLIFLPKIGGQQSPLRPHAFRWPYKGLFVSAIFLLDDGVNYDNTTHKIDHQLLKVH